MPIKRFVRSGIRRAEWGTRKGRFGPARIALSNPPRVAHGICMK
jgi:hypothetical protein